MNIIEIVVQPTWREFLMDLVASKQMNPWEIDIGEITDAYLEKIRELKAMDLRIPANVILACALLLKFKSQSLRLDDETQEVAGEKQPRVLLNEDIPLLVFRTNKPRTRRLSLQELLDAIEEVMKSNTKRVYEVEAAPKELTIELPQMDMNQLMKRVLERAHQHMDCEQIVVFTKLLDEQTSEQVAFTILPVLHLVQEKKLVAWQDEFFGEIFIKVIMEGQQHPDDLVVEQPSEEDYTLCRKKTASIQQVAGK